MRKTKPGGVSVKAPKAKDTEMWYNNFRLTELYVNGINAEADILKIEELGESASANTVVEMTLSVAPEHRRSFQTKGRTVISNILIPRSGDTIKIKYDPADITRFVVI